MNIEKLIQNLNTEIQQTADGVDKEKQLARLTEIAKVYRGEDKIISFEDVAERIRNQKDEVKIMSGWTGLDRLLNGFRLQQVVVVSALTKSGKTSFLMDLTSRIKEFHPVWFPFEESAEELIRKYVERGEEPPHGYTPQEIRGSTIEWIESKIIEAIAKHGSKVVFIDQLDFIIPYGADNHALRIGQAMRDLKAVAKKWNVCIFLICHLTKARMDTQPTLEDLKGSSSIGQEADTVIMLWRQMRRFNGEVEITDNVNVSVQANRRTGRTGNIKMVFKEGRFLEQVWEMDEQGELADDF